MFRRELTYEEVIERLKEKNITIRMASPKLVMEEAPESYKDVEDVCNTCNLFLLIRSFLGHEAGISKKVLKLRPIAVIKGQSFIFLL